MNNLSVLSGLLSTIGFIPYIFDIVRKKTQPSRTTWIIWAVVDSVTLSGMIFGGAKNIGQMIGATTGSVVTALLLVKYGRYGWSLLDKICLVGAGIGIALWIWFNNPILAVIMSLAVTVIGFIPTIVSTWYNPDSENKFGWTMWWISSSVSMFAAIPHWTFINYAQPLVFLLSWTIIMYILYIRPWGKKK